MAMKQIVDIKYLLNSEESTLLNNIALLGCDQGDGKYKKPEFFYKEIFPYLFESLKPVGSEHNIGHFLKNKYLYYLTGGALSYLEGIASMHTKIESDYDQEKKCIEKLITFNKISFDDYDFVSFGPGDGSSDIKLIKEFYNTKNFKYFPIDISPHLLQLTINKFKEENRLAQTTNNIIPINCDFFELNDSVKKILDSSNRRKIFTLLGGTIGNYKEGKLLEKLSDLMEDGEYLFISFDIFNSDKELQDIKQQYITDGNVEFLKNPFKLIQKFIDIEKFRFFDKMNYIHNDWASEVTDSRSFTPKIKLADQSYDITVAWTTKYKCSEMEDFLKNLVSFELIDLTNEPYESARTVALLKKINPLIDNLKNTIKININNISGAKSRNKALINNLNTLDTMVKNSQNIDFLKETNNIIFNDPSDQNIEKLINKYNV